MKKGDIVILKDAVVKPMANSGYKQKPVGKTEYRVRYYMEKDKSGWLLLEGIYNKGENAYGLDETPFSETWFDVVVYKGPAVFDFPDLGHRMRTLTG